MGLSLYRRHKKDCRAGHPHNSKTVPFLENKKTYKRCDCRITVAGTLGKEFSRQSTGCWEWEKAEEVRLRLEAAGSWEALKAAPKPAPLPPSGGPAPEVLSPGEIASGKTIENAVAKFIKGHEDWESADGTLKKYRLFLESVKRYAALHGLNRLDQWGKDEVSDLESSWQDAPVTRSRKMSILKTFFTFCVKKQMIDHNPASGAWKPKNRTTRQLDAGKERLPFSDLEIQRMVDGCSRYGQGVNSRKTNFHSYKWFGQDVLDFILLSLHTGMRISDVATFSASCVSRNTDGWGVGIVYPIKQHGQRRMNKPVKLTLKPWMVDLIHRRAKEHGDLIFGAHVTTDLNTKTDQWRRRLKRLWKMEGVGPFEDKPDHHRFRHTFARMMLENDEIEIRDVAEALGDTEAVVRRTYAKWVKEREDRFQRKMRAFHASLPEPNMIVPIKQLTIQ